MNASATETDAVVIGAGPVGLYQAFQLGLQGLRVHLIDALPQPGGQCLQLYGDKPIYDIPAIPVCTGRELADLLRRQIEPFKPHWHLATLVCGFGVCADRRLRIETDRGARLKARAVFIAAGLGAFVARQLKIDGLERFAGSQLHYQRLPAGIDLAGRQIVVHGGDEAAVAQAVELAQQAPAARISLLHRRAVFQAPAALLQDLQRLRAAGRIAVQVGQISAITTADAGARLTGLELLDAQGSAHRLAADLLIAHTGLSPRLGPLADWGLQLERKQIPVDSASCATNIRNVYAVGDINHYPGKRKLIVCGFHEATLAAFAAAEAIQGGKLPLQYTTTSPRLQQLLGVAQPPAQAASAAAPPPGAPPESVER